MIILKFPLEVLKTTFADGLTRVRCAMPMSSTVLHLGANPPDEGIYLTALCPEIAPGPDGVVHVDPSKIVAVEFIIAQAGDKLPDANYICRAPVRLPTGMLFLFEKKQGGPSLIVPQRIAQG